MMSKVPANNEALMPITATVLSSSSNGAALAMPTCKARRITDPRIHHRSRPSACKSNSNIKTRMMAPPYCGPAVLY